MDELSITHLTVKISPPRTQQESIAGREAARSNDKPRKTTFLTDLGLTPVPEACNVV